jgi:hypothetical protein
VRRASGAGGSAPRRAARRRPGSRRGPRRTAAGAAPRCRTPTAWRRPRSGGTPRAALLRSGACGRRSPSRRARARRRSATGGRRRTRAARLRCELGRARIRQPEVIVHRIDTGRVVRLRPGDAQGHAHAEHQPPGVRGRNGPARPSPIRCRRWLVAGDEGDRQEERGGRHVGRIAPVVDVRTGGD